MSSVVRGQRALQVFLAGLTMVAIVALNFLTAAAGEREELVKKLGFDPDEIPAVKWLPKPVPNPAAEATTEAEMKPYTEAIPDTDVKFDMVPVPGGKFMMGSPDDEEGRKDDEGPQREVVIEPFWMGKCEVTWDEYELWYMELDYHRRKIMGTKQDDRNTIADAVTRPTKPYTDMTFGMGQSGYPAICMTQLAARMYCKWLSAKTGHYYRLPTEAEWEYACRAGTTTPFSFGDDPDDLEDYGWYFDNSPDGYHKVGLLKPNPWGLYDMHGNAAEWVIDQYVADLYKKESDKVVKNPFVVPKSEHPVASGAAWEIVARGGSWNDDPETLRSAARLASDKSWKMQDPQIPQSIWYMTETFCPGFRVVRPLNVPDEIKAKKYDPDIKVIREYEESSAGKH